MTLLLLLTLFTVQADTLRLDALYRAAEANAPRRQELALQEAITALKVRNLDARYLPSVALGGQATYQSEVATIPFSLPGERPVVISKDQYKVMFNMDQLVYDGGLVAQQKAIERAARDVAQQEVAVDLYRLRDQINAAYFGALMAQAQRASLQTLEEDLQARLGQVQARIRQGVLTASNADVLAAELIKIRQQQTDAESRRLAALDVLSERIGQALAADVVLALPPSPDAGRDLPATARPEYRLFDLTKTRLSQQEGLAARKNRPVVATFAEAAYGRPPGLNFFKNEFRPYFSLGLRVKWAFWDWRTGMREQEMLALQREVVSAQEATFTQSLNVALTQAVREIARLETLLQSDAEIIALRARIAAEAASRLENGVLTATDYLVERNAEHQARLTEQLHRIQLVQARVQHATIKGKD